MIEFRHKLPSLNIDGRHNGTYNNTELAIPGILTTSDSVLGEFIHLLRSNIYKGRALVFVDGKYMMCNKNWIRDHVHVMKGMKHFEYEIQNFLDFIIDTQREDGQFYELIKQYDDPHWQFVNSDCRVLYPDDNLTLVRLELEADIEYLVVEGVNYVYRIKGDDEWLKSVLPRLEKGINYITSDPKRWDAEHGLVKRPFTIDTWDFTDAPTSPHDRSIHDGEQMSIMHGDNSGVYQAMTQLAWFNRRLGNEEKALSWERRAETLRENMFRYLWNGRFFIHQLHLNHSGKDGKESERLSLSNTYDINRGVTDCEQAGSIIREYMRRRESTDKFAEWFTVDPPYEKFLHYKDGEYVNGAISPFTAGELAKAAFCNGYEEYGYDIISRFIKLAQRDGDVYFLYYPDSMPQADGGPSTWGAAALLSAVDEGLAGVVDADVGYRVISFSPRFAVTQYDELRYFTGYEQIGAIVDIRYILTAEGMRYDVSSPAHTLHNHILLPKGKSCAAVYVNGETVPFTPCKVANSDYVDFDVHSDGKISMEILFMGDFSK